MSHPSTGKHIGGSYVVEHCSWAESMFNPDCLLITNITGGVVTLDPCGHLCSLDGIQVTVPTPLTQGKMHTHTDMDIYTYTDSPCHGRHIHKLWDIATYWSMLIQQCMKMIALLRVYFNYFIMPVYVWEWLVCGLVNLHSFQCVSHVHS